MTGEPNGDTTWWTFAGTDANRWLASGLGELRTHKVQDDAISITLRSGAKPQQVRDQLEGLHPETLSLSNALVEGAIEQLKFHQTLPPLLAAQVITQRLRADETVRAVVTQPIRGIQLAEPLP